MTKSVCFIERNFILDIEWGRNSKRNEAKVLSLSLDSTFNNNQSATALSLGSSFMYRLIPATMRKTQPTKPV